MDPGVVHHKADISVSDSWETVGEGLKECHEVSCFESSPFHRMEDNPLRGDAHEERDVDPSVGRDSLDGSCSSFRPASERGDVEVEPTLVEEPELLVFELLTS